jgi:multiple sugar transport system substrate-binding protein
MMRSLGALCTALVLLVFAASVRGLPAQTLVTADRIGRPDAPIVISWQAIPTYSLQNPFPTRKDYLMRAAEAWIQKHPNVRIDPLVSPGNISEAMTRLLEQAAARRAPDVAQIDGFVLPRYFPLLQPLGAYEPRADLDDLFPFARAEMTAPDGTVRALRFTTDVRVLYYRKDLVPTPPQTWDELVDAASRVAKEKGIAGFLYSAGRDEGAVFDTMLPWLCGQGAKLVDASGRPVLNEGKNREALLNILRFERRTVESGATPARVVTIGQSSDINRDAAAGQVAMFIGGNWQVAQLKEILPASQFAEWDIAPIPQMVKGQRGTAAGGWAWGVFTSDPQKQRLAVDFVDAVYAGPGGMAQWTKVGGYLPTRASAYNNTVFANDPLMPKFRSMLATACSRPPFPIYTTISSELQVAAGDVVSGRKSPEDALAAVAQKVAAEYQLSK